MKKPIAPTKQKAAPRPRVKRQPVLDSEGTVVAERQVVEGEVGQNFTVAKDRVKVMTESFAMLGTTGAAFLAEARLAGVEAQLTFHLLSTMTFGNKVILNVSEFVRLHSRSPNTSYAAVKHLVEIGVIQRIDGGPGRCTHFVVNPSIVWKGRDRREREEAVKRWDDHVRRAKREAEAEHPQLDLLISA